MRFNIAPNRTLLAALFGAVMAAGLGVFLDSFRVGTGLANLSFDLLTVARGDRRVPEAVLVYMDDAAHDALGQARNAPWDRTLHARLIDELTGAGAKAIVFDVVFSDSETNRPAVDERLAAAMKASGRVVIAADHVSINDTDTRFVMPANPMRDAAATIGSAEVLPGRDLIVRRHAPNLELNSLSWATAELLGASATQQSAERATNWWINYYSRPNGLDWFSYHEVFDPKVLARGPFKDKVVFVGGRLFTKFAGDRKDEYRNPFSYWKIGGSRGSEFISGVEIQATAFLNLLRGDWLTRLPPWEEQLLLGLLGAVLGFGLVRLRPFPATGAALGALVMGTAGSYFLFARHSLWFPWLIVVVQIIAALSWSVLFNSVQFYVQKRLMEHTLSLYLSPKLVGKFARDPKLLKPGAEKQVLTIVFTDIEDFTPLTQGLDSNELAEFMNRYFQEIVSGCIHKTDGTVVKYIGDAVFCFWNAPEAQSDHALRACEAALLMRGLKAMKMRGNPVRTRVGIHTGEANVGNFGSVERVDYTALGENVNLASRLEGLNKFVGTDCLISAATRAAIGDRLITRRVGLFTLKGFNTSVEAFEIVDQPGEAPKTKEWREAFEQALRNYEDGNFEFATMGFRGVLELKPDDGPTKFYLERLEDVSKQPVEGDWTGDTMLREK